MSGAGNYCRTDSALPQSAAGAGPRSSTGLGEWRGWGPWGGGGIPLGGGGGWWPRTRDHISYFAPGLQATQRRNASNKPSHDRFPSVSDFRNGVIVKLLRWCKGFCSANILLKLISQISEGHLVFYIGKQVCTVLTCSCTVAWLHQLIHSPGCQAMHTWKTNFHSKRSSPPRICNRLSGRPSSSSQDSILESSCEASPSHTTARSALTRQQQSPKPVEQSRSLPQ